MKSLRLGLSIMTCALLAAGYAASQFAFAGHLGGPDGWASRLAEAPIAALGVGLVAAAIVLCLIPDDEESS